MGYINYLVCAALCIGLHYFQAVKSGIGYRNQRNLARKGYHFPGNCLISQLLVGDFSLDSENRELTLKKCNWKI